tara:strand:- start:43 stop:2001 length:1959 start_codon:yes stop_codon:yes gene_type:complete
MKILKPETTLASATHVYKSSVVRLFNSGSSNILVTRKNESGSTIGSFMVPAGEVVYCEKDYTDTLEGGADVKVTKTAFSPMMSFVSQTDTGPTYTHAVSATNVDEGGSFTTTITTTNVDDGTNLYWELSGTNITSADFSSGALTGTASISSNSATFSHTVANDTLTEGTETVTIKVYSDSGRNTQVGNTLSVTLADTSTTPVNNPGHYSVRFNADVDDTNEQISVTNSDYATGNNEFTVEAFAKIYSLDTYNTIFGTRGSNANVPTGWTVGMQSNKQFYFYSTGFHIDTAAQTGIANEEWFHIAIQRENPSGGNVFRLYLNGTVIGSTTQNKNFTNTKFNIGTEAVGQQWNGWISNVRFSTTLVYPWGGFTAPTAPLSTVSQGATNVKYLGCRDSTLAATHISNGTQAIQGTPGPTVSTDDPFANVNNNYAVDFTGTQDVKRVTASHSSLAIGTDQFTIECWFKTASIAASVSPSSYHTIIGSREENTDNAGGGIILALNDSGKFVIFSSGFHIDPDTSVWDAANYINQWVHVALTRDSNNLLTLWLDGANKGTMSNFTNNLTRSAFAFGNLVNTGQEDFSGLISNARITIGQALYSSAFTPSTEPLTVSSQGATASNVKFLGLNASSVTSDSVGTATVTSNNSPTSTTGPF